MEQKQLCISWLSEERQPEKVTLLLTDLNAQKRTSTNERQITRLSRTRRRVDEGRSEEQEKKRRGRKDESTLYPLLEPSGTNGEVSYTEPRPLEPTTVARPHRVRTSHFLDGSSPSLLLKKRRDGEERNSVLQHIDEADPVYHRHTLVSRASPV